MPPYPRESTKGMDRVLSVWHNSCIVSYLSQHYSFCSKDGEDAIKPIILLHILSYPEGVTNIMPTQLLLSIMPTLMHKQIACRSKAQKMEQQHSQ